MGNLTFENFSSPSSSFDESKIYEFVVNKGYGVKGLVDSGITSVPSRYIHPPNERIDRTKTIDASPYLVPPIDLSELEGNKKDEIIKTICRAAEMLGFFQVVNHGVSDEVMERVKFAAHTFFNLPPEEKAVYLKSKCTNVSYGTSFSPEVENSLEWKDYLSLLYMDDEEALRLWPKQCRHSDLAALTVLLQDGIGGLYVKVEDKGWIEIPPVKGALVINVGDTFEILSNGRYKSAEHRAVASSTKARVSIPIFTSPRPHTMIGPFPGLPEKDGKIVYKQLLFGDYMTNFFGGAHQGKKTLDFAKV
ncbi:hypothetical protein GIB67_006951 [Kingdonia uniflora]|uniref:Fe2OG dioxygenase domain-containing protein n=1 Tax=Kingdonia uniflora TaxID=39325 RepID=A0A7J7NZT8_9MAGN|nr:hypothetical protein GIB67_006951 [Kingdonia uniflora]